MVWPLSRITGYEVEPEEAALDHSAKAEGGGNKRDRSRHEGLSSEGSADLEILFRERAWSRFSAGTLAVPVSHISSERQAAHTHYRFGARMLERVINRVCISHNRIHMYLKRHSEVGLARRDTVRRHHLQLPQRGPGEGAGEQLCLAARHDPGRQGEAHGRKTERSGSSNRSIAGAAS